MRMRFQPVLPGRQDGWVGMLVILIALLIVAWLSKDALMKYGMLDGGGAAATKRSTAPGAAAGSDAEPATPSNVREKAQALEGLLQKESTKRDGGN